MHNLIPTPASILPSAGSFTISSSTKITLQNKNEEMTSIANLLSAYLGRASGFEIETVDADEAQGVGDIELQLNREKNLGEEGYELSITTDAILLRANYPAGLFYGAQTLRQLLPAA